MAHRKKRDVWPSEFLALAGAWRGDIPRPGQRQTRRIKTITIREASVPLGEYASRLKGDILVVTKGQRAVAALVPLENVDRESLVLSGHPDFLRLIERSRAEIDAGKTLSLAEIKSRVLGECRRGKRHVAASKRRKAETPGRSAGVLHGRG